jgi:hypothetical protein
MTNWNLLRKVADRIERENRFDMSTYGYQDECGTVACTAGHIVWMLYPEEFEEKIKWSIGMDWVFVTACEELDIDVETADDFFVPTDRIAIPQINYNKNLVPAALRWMADNECLDWNKAGPAVGFKEMVNEFADSEAQRLYAECEEISQFDMA